MTCRQLDVLTVEIAKLRLEPGDVLVLSCRHRLSAEQVERLAQQVKNRLRPEEHGYAVMVLDESCDLKVVKPPQRQDER